MAEEQDEALASILEMFPEAHPDTALECLKSNNGSLEVTITDMLQITGQADAPVPSPEPAAGTCDYTTPVGADVGTAGTSVLSLMAAVEVMTAEPHPEMSTQEVPPSPHVSTTG